MAVSHLRGRKGRASWKCPWPEDRGTGTCARRLPAINAVSFADPAQRTNRKLPERQSDARSRLVTWIRGYRRKVAMCLPGPFPAQAARSPLVPAGNFGATVGARVLGGRPRFGRMQFAQPGQGCAQPPRQRERPALPASLALADPRRVIPEVHVLKLAPDSLGVRPGLPLCPK
jgi:hypothetical protein